MKNAIKLEKCKCGEQLNLREGSVWWGVRVMTISSYCPKKKWYNSWRHWKPRIHAYMPHPSVNQWKPSVLKQLKENQKK